MNANTAGPALEVARLSKSYGEVQALRDVDLSIRSGEYFVLLGPSGGGKTTLLRVIGGFIRPSSGKVFLHGSDVSGLPPDKRPTSMVFQSYALFPHMTVARNVGYGLRLRRMPKSEVDGRVEAMLEMVGLAGFGARMPHELSGGQQQRVQLARALVLEADILLLDEPLAALDAKLRKDMCVELKHLQEKVGITFIHVTHNQEEAMTVADRIAIIADGELVEEGTAQEIYRHPKRRFTADFIGENNIFEGTAASVADDGIVVDTGYGSVTVPARGEVVAPGAPVSFSIRSERMRLLSAEQTGEGALQTLPGTFREDIYLGLLMRHMVAMPDGREVNVRTLVDLNEPAGLNPGMDVRVGWETADARLHLS